MKKFFYKSAKVERSTMNKTAKSKKQQADAKPETRDATFTREGIVEVMTREAEGDKPAAKFVRLSVSSEEPYLKWVWDDEVKDYIRAYEVLGHRPGEIDFSRMKGGLVIQDGHYGKQIGIIDAPEVKDGKLGGVVRFGHSQDAKDCEADALDGIRKNMSVGYFVGEYKRDGVAEDGYPIFRAVKWTPFEGSFVNVPADTSVGVGRSHEETSESGAAASLTVTGGKEMTKEEIEAAIAAAVKENTEASQKRVAELEAELKALKEKKPETPAPAAAAKAFDEKDTAIIAKRYDIAAVIRALAGEKVDVGFERELSDQIAKAAKKEARGLFIPDAAFRTLTGKTNVSDHITGNGAATVATELLASQYIEALVARTVLGQAGVTILDGLTGDIALPKGGVVTAGWLTAEDGDATVGTPAFTQVAGTPHTVSSNVDISRKLVLQSSLSVQALITGMILDAIARGVEAAAFDGTGSSGQPTGLSATANVGSVSMVAGAPTKEKLVEFWEKVYTANAGGPNMKYIGSPAVKALLCKTLDYFGINASGAKATSSVVGGIGAGYLCTKDGQVEGYDFLMSGLCNSKKLYFGDWSQLVLAFWSGVDLTVDPYSLSTKGALRLVAFQDCDVLVRHPQAFAIGTALS